MRHLEVQPMLATLGKPPTRYADFAVEAKYDGQRGMAIVENGRVFLLSRNGADITNTFPEVSAALPYAVPSGRTVLDGEIVALDCAGAPSFTRLQRRWPQNRRPSAELLRTVPVRFLVFDMLSCAGTDLTPEPYKARRERLHELVAGPVIQVPGSWSGIDPAVLLESTLELGLEGIVCKHLDSTYTPGQRSRDWIKTPHRRRSQFVIGGWLPGGVNRSDIGALLVGCHELDGRLRFCGAVGTGIGAAERRRLMTAIRPLARSSSPFASMHPAFAGHALWLAPELVGDIEYREFDRGLLRHPSWKGLRPDLFGTQVPAP